MQIYMPRLLKCVKRATIDLIKARTRGSGTAKSRAVLSYGLAPDGRRIPRRAT